MHANNSAWPMHQPHFQWSQHAKRRRSAESHSDRFTKTFCSYRSWETFGFPWWFPLSKFGGHQEQNFEPISEIIRYPLSRSASNSESFSSSQGSVSRDAGFCFKWQCWKIVKGQKTQKDGLTIIELCFHEDQVDAYHGFEQDILSQHVTHPN